MRKKEPSLKSLSGEQGASFPRFPLTDLNDLTFPVVFPVVTDLTYSIKGINMRFDETDSPQDIAAVLFALLPDHKLKKVLEHMLELTAAEEWITAENIKGMKDDVKDRALRILELRTGPYGDTAPAAARENS
jgi:hypothetical protein